MSSKVLERPTLLKQQRVVRWAEAEEIEDIPAIDVTYPINVDGDKLEIDSAQLEIGRVYSFNYLGVEMVLWKLPDGTIDLFQIIEE
jgi:hypothetical protein